MILLDAVPSVTNESQIALSGRVARIPAEPVTITVTLTRGVNVSTVNAGGDGGFAMDTYLSPNGSSLLVLVATDETGAVSAPESLAVRHDNVSPVLVSASPQGDLASTTPSVELAFSEAVRLAPGAALYLLHQGRQVAGVTTLPDSTHVQFVPGQRLLPNSVYTVVTDAVEDLAGNVRSGTGPCFVTTIESAPSTVVSDLTDDWFYLGTPSTAAAPDIRQTRLTAQGGLLSVTYQFTTPRGFGPGVLNNTFVYLELDTDENAQTGFPTLKDLLFEGSGLSSGIKAEWVVALDWIPGFGDSAMVGRYVDTLTISVQDVIYPDICGAFFGFEVSTALVGDDGRFGFTSLAGMEQALALLVDPAPEDGHSNADLSAGFAPSMTTAPPTGRPTRVMPLRRRP